MSAIKIPVSFEFFKKYTYHEEWVEIMLKAKANGHPKTYEALISSSECRERALRSYYEAFYLKPKIRENYHIRLKAVPKKIKDKLLLIPVQDTSVAIDDNKNVIECPMEDVINCLDSSHKSNNEENAQREEHKKRLLEAAKDNNEEDQMVEDDSEPLSSPDISPTSSSMEACDKNKTPIKIQRNSEQEKSAKTTKENVKNKSMENNNINKSTKEQKRTTEPSAASNKKPNINYKDLVPYTHCCPLTYKEFRKYSNINQLVKEFCEKQHLESSKERMILNRSYILFYLAPDHRNIAPINKIQLVENCPLEIKNKFFTIPTKLYLKGEQNLNKTQENVTQKPKDIEINAISEDQQATTSPVNQAKTTNEVEPILNSQTVGQITEATGITNKNEQQLTNQIKTNELANTHSPEKLNKTTQQATIKISNEPTITPALNIPVSIDEFKKYTYFEEIVDKLFQIKAHDNEELFRQYKNSHEAFDLTLNNYYRAFYLTPCVRQTLPIRFKALPSFVKKRLLQIPEGVNEKSINDFRIEQLVAPEEENLRKFEDLITIKTEKDVESSDSDNTTNSSKTAVKRTTKDDIMSSSPKRQKIQQPIQPTQDYSENTQKTKKSYKDLLPYAHCCPVTFSEFKNYTNITELFSGYCQKRYNSVNKLPYMLKRAYVLYYLAPENRNFKPFNKLQILSKCPQHLRDKMHEIPTNIYLKDDKRNEVKIQEPMETEIPAEIKQEVLEETKEIEATKQQRQEITIERQQQICSKVNTSRNAIQILENRLLSPTKLSFINQSYSNKESLCSFNNCVFHHISHLEFIQQTNILYLIPQSQDMSVMQTIFKKFIYKIIKEQNCDDKLVVNSSLLCKLVKYKEICQKCDNAIQSLLKQDTTSASGGHLETERTSTANNECVIERNVERTPSNVVESIDIDEPGITQQEITKSSNTQPIESFTKTSPKQQQTKDKPSVDLWKSLKTDKIFTKFLCKLLSKLNQSLDKSLDFSSETYKIFLQCNEIPLKQLLNNFCDNNEDIVQRILKEQELCEALKRYYYSKYLTNNNFALKYPPKLKQKPLQENNQQTSNDKESKNENVKDKINPETPIKHLKQQENLNDKTPSHIVAERAKRIFFRNVEKNNTLSYILRTSFGLKQLILQTILSITYEEFIEITNIYEGYQLYADNHIAECMYHYVFRTPMVWPTNLYISLKQLCEFLHKKNIRFNDYSTMLKYISPKILHWSGLLSCTNIVDCVKIDYENRTGKSLNSDVSLKHECIEYYNRCWKQEKWLGDIPRVDEEFYKEFLNSNEQGDVTMLDESGLLEICEEQNVAENDIVEDKDNADVSSTEGEVCKQSTDSNLNTNAAGETEINNETTKEINTSSSANQSLNEFNCIILPNTQQQIEMLPSEVRISNDPLNSSRSTQQQQQQNEMLTTEVRISNDPLNNSKNMSSLNVSSTTSENNDEVITVGELVPTIKNENINKNLLTNLLFYEDDNSNIQCTPLEDEVIDLEVSKTEVFENLPPSQMDFDNETVEIILSDNLINSDNSDVILNLGQRIPSSGESNDEQFMQQQQNIPITSTQLRQLPDVTLKSSGEDECPENVKGNQQQLGNVTHTGTEKQLGSLQNILVTSTTSLQSFITYPEAQRFPSTFEDIQTYSGNVNTETENKSLQQEEILSTPTETTTKENVSIPMVRIEVQQQINNENTTSLQVKHSTNIGHKALPLRRCIPKSCAIVKSPKNVAKVRPLKNSNYVPQIQHNTRPLLTKPAYIANSHNKDNNEQQTMITTATDDVDSAPIAQVANSTNTLTPTETNTVNSCSQDIQNSSLQLHLSPLGTHIFISQELNKNCSVFNNSSLLRIADHNYHQQTTSNNLSASSTILTTVDENTEKEERAGTQEQQTATQQPTRRVTRSSSQCQINNSQQAIINPTTKEITQPVSPRRVKRRTSLYKDTNDKVNNNNLPLNPTNNPVATIAPTIYHHHTNKMVHKLCLYRDLIKFHYFKHLTPQHISKYLLPSIEFGKSYMEATIVCEQFKTRITNRSISGIFSFWPQKLQRDFLLVLSDLKEFHYVAFERNTMQSKEDLRARILFWFLNTAPLFSLCLLTYEANNTEFAHCESITNGNNPSYKRKPFKCLTNALNMKILDKLRDMKRDLRGNS